MDTLSQRYACPFLILDEFIRLDQLHDFLEEVMKTIAEERNWEFYLHKVYDKSYKEFIDGLEKPTVNEMSCEDMKSIVQESASILDGFTG